mgnify:CR=1 FL=1
MLAAGIWACAEGANAFLADAREAMDLTSDNATYTAVQGVLQAFRRRLTPQHYFKSEAEMCALFADLPEALAYIPKDRVILTEIADPKSTRRSVGALYAVLIGIVGERDLDWTPINLAIRDRFGGNGPLDRVKKAGWSLYDRTVATVKEADDRVG